MSAIDSFQLLPEMQIIMPSSLDTEHEAANSLPRALSTHDRALTRLRHAMELPSEWYRWTCSELHLLLAVSLIHNSELESDLRRTVNSVGSCCTVPSKPCGNEAAEINGSRDCVLNPQSRSLEPFTRTDGFKPVIPFPQLLQPTSARSLYLDLLGGFKHHQQYMSLDIPTLTTKRTTPCKPRLVNFEASLPLSVNREILTLQQQQ